MSIKILDSDCAINLLERMRSFDCIPFLSEYETIVTSNVISELKKGNSFENIPFEIHTLTNDERAIFEDTANYISRLGAGERSVMIHALFLSNEHSCKADDKIVVLCNDKEANHIFHNDLSKDPMIKRLFPNYDKIIWSRTVDVIEKMWNIGLIDDKTGKSIYEDLRIIIGPKLDFLKQ